MAPVRSKSSIWCSITFLTIAGLLLAACTPAAAPALATAVPVTGNNAPPAATQVSQIPESVTPSVKVSDQPVSGGEVTVEQVSSPGPGWIVIHINANGAPGAIIGWSQVNAGVNPPMKVAVDASKATSVLYAMLHVDAGKVGTYEFPGPDVPLMVNGQMVNPAFAVTGGGVPGPAATAAATSAGSTAAPAAPAATNTTAAGGYGYSSTATAPAAMGQEPAAGQSAVSIANNAQLGQILVDSKGMTLYIFKKDSPGVSNCTGGCLENWPPLLVDSGNPQAGKGVNGKLSTLTRSDNGTQIMYNDMPLYYFAGDKAPGDINGQGIGGVWSAATP